VRRFLVRQAQSQVQPVLGPGSPPYVKDQVSVVLHQFQFMKLGLQKLQQLLAVVGMPFLADQRSHMQYIMSARDVEELAELGVLAVLICFW